MESFNNSPQGSPVPQSNPSAAPAYASMPSMRHYRAAYIAYDLVAPELASVQDHERVRITVDVPTAVFTGLGALPALYALQPQIAEQIAGFPSDQLVRVERYGLAAWHAHILSLGEDAAESLIAPLLPEAQKLRQDLLVAAETMARFGIIPSKKLELVRGGPGHLDIANDLGQLGAMFAASWPAIGATSPIDRDRVERARTLSTEIGLALGPRFQPTGPRVPMAQAADNRIRAFSLFVREYDVCRKAVAYLRWSEDDVDELVPSLFSKPRSSRKADSEPEAAGVKSEASGPAPPEPAPRAA